MSKQITLRIKRVHLENLVFGDKRIEYRNVSPFYASRICKNFSDNGEETEAEIRNDITSMKVYCPLGRSGKNLEAIFPVKTIDTNDEGTQFRIHVGDCIEHNLPKPKAK